MKEDFKIVLLRGDCPQLEQALNLKLLNQPCFLKNFSSNNNLSNSKLQIGNDWETITFIAIKDSSNFNDLKPEDILLYVNFYISRPHNIISELELISFCDNMNRVCHISGKILDRLHDVYGIEIVSFTAKEGATIQKMFNLVTNSQELTNKYFNNWQGRYVGYRTLGFVDQAGKKHNKHIFEVLRKNTNFCVDN